MTLPSPDNDYAAPLNMKLSRAVWDAVFASIGQRLRAFELTTADYDAAVNLIETQALAVITATITDEINARRADLDTITEDAAALADEIAFIRAGGVDAANVAVAEIAGLAAVNAQAAIAELLTKIEEEATARTAALDAITTALAGAETGIATTLKFS